MNIKKICIISLLLIFTFTSFSNEPDKEKRVYQTKRVNGETPVIDGLINEKAWEFVEWSGNFTQRSPNDGDDPSQETSFKILYDDNNLYIAVRAYDKEPDKIVKRMSRRDGFDGDWIKINIDSYFDKQTAFSFTASVSGVKGDEAITDDGDNWDGSWDPIWYLKTSLDNKGWIVEIKIPFTQLRFSNAEEQVWGIQFTRRVYREEERSNWQYIPQDVAGWVHHFGELHGIKGIKPKKQIEFSPYALTKIEKYEEDEFDPFSHGFDLGISAGLDGKIGITNDFTLDFTINPDFGQVEADPSEVNLTAFETYFQEKRPFFIEGRNITDYQISYGGNSFARDNLFYSRRIGRSPHYYPDLNDTAEYADVPGSTHILGAIKITGKTKKGLSVGVINSVTTKEMAKIDSYGIRSKEIVEPWTNYFVGRVKKDMNNNNTILGGMVTSTNRNLEDDHLNFLNTSANTGGLDFAQYWKDRKYYFMFNYAMSHIKGDVEAIHGQQESSRRYFQRPDNDYVNYDTTRTSLTGHAGTLQFGKQGSSKLRFVFWWTWRSPEFELNDVGFLHHSDANFQVFWASYRWTDPFSIFRTMQLNFNQWSGFDFGMNNNFKGGNVNTWMEFVNHWRFGAGVNIDGRGLSNSMLRGGPSIKTQGQTNYWLNFGTDNRKKVYGWGNFNQGFGFDNSSKYTSVGIDIYFRPTDAIRISFLPDYFVYKNELQYISTEEVNNEDRYYFAKINQIRTDLTIRIDYVVSPNLTIQYYGSPFISAVNYSKPKYINDPKAENFTDRFTYDNTFTNYEDFNFREFRSNFVVRWEYRPGSLLYLVWTQNRSGSEEIGTFSYNDDLGGMFDIHPYNVFLVKFSYRIAIN